MLNDHLRATGASLLSADDFRLTQVIPAVMGAVEPELVLARAPIFPQVWDWNEPKPQ